MNKPFSLLALVATVALNACGESHAPGESNILVRRVSPTAANSAVRNFTPDHLIWIDTIRPSARLVLFLGGTAGVPEAYTHIGHVVAAHGFRVIGLMYPNDVGVVFNCEPDPDPDCMEELRHEIVDGGDFSTHVEVDQANSIAGRLADLLRWLDREYPGEGWNGFLAGDSPAWDLITVAGHSQGGGHAAYIAATRQVRRVVMLGAPTDGFNEAPAPWMQLAATPASRYYGFRHQRDHFTSISPNWLALGLDQFGQALMVDASTTSFGDSHMLVTDQLPATGSYSESHSSVAVDWATPVSATGLPAFAVIWRYLFGDP